MQNYLIAAGFLALLLLGLYLIVISFIRILKPLSRIEPQCKKCKYTLINLSSDASACPECGMIITPDRWKIDATWRTSRFSFHPALTLAPGLLLLMLVCLFLPPVRFEANWWEVSTWIHIQAPDAKYRVELITSWRDEGWQWKLMNIPWLTRSRIMALPPTVSGPYRGLSQPSITVLIGPNGQPLPTPSQLEPTFLSSPPITSIPVNREEIAKTIQDQLKNNPPPYVVDQVLTDVLALYAGTPVDKLQSVLDPRFTVIHESRNSLYGHTFSPPLLGWPLLLIPVALWILVFYLARAKRKVVIAYYNPNWLALRDAKKR